MLKFKIFFILIFLLSILPKSAKSQIDLSANHNVLVQAGIYEGLSLRYENSIIVRDNFLLLGYLGISTAYHTFSSKTYYANNLGIPIGLNLIFGKSKHHFESSIGYLWQKNYFEYPRSTRDDQYQLKLGYRFQKLKAHSLIFKAGMTISFEVSNAGSDFVLKGINRFDLGPFIGIGYGL